MIPVSTLVRVELARLLRRPMTRVLTLAFVGISLIVYGTVIGMILVAESSLGEQVQDIDAASLRESMLLPDGVFFGGTLISIVGSILLIVLAAGSVGSEFTWATFRTSVFMGVSRVRLLVAKFLALAVMSLLAILLGLVTTLGLALLGELIVGRGEIGAREFGAAFAGDVLLTIGVTFIVILVWAVIAAGITLMTHSLATGLGITLVVSFLGGQVALLIGQLGTVGDWIERAFPNTATNELSVLLSTDPPSLALTDWLWISANVAGWMALAVLASIAVFRRMNLLATS